MAMGYPAVTTQAASTRGARVRCLAKLAILAMLAMRVKLTLRATLATLATMATLDMLDMLDMLGRWILRGARVRRPRRLHPRADLLPLPRPGAARGYST